MLVEAGGTLVAETDVQVHSPGTAVAQGRGEGFDQPAAVAAGLQARQQVDVRV